MRIALFVADAVEGDGAVHTRHIRATRGCHVFRFGEGVVGNRVLDVLSGHDGVVTRLITGLITGFITGLIGFILRAGNGCSKSNLIEIAVAGVVGSNYDDIFFAPFQSGQRHYLLRIEGLQIGKQHFLFGRCFSDSTINHLIRTEIEFFLVSHGFDV